MSTTYRKDVAMIFEIVLRCFGGHLAGSSSAVKLWWNLESLWSKRMGASRQLGCSWQCGDCVLANLYTSVTSRGTGVVGTILGEYLGK